MCAPDFPDPPAPQETSKAQTGTNVATSIANTQQGQVNRVTPEGTLTYDQTGTYQFTDPFTGMAYDIPTYTATERLTPEAQEIHTVGQEAKRFLGHAAKNQAESVSHHLGSAFKPDTEAIEARLNELMAARAEPRFAEDEAKLRTMLANKGISEGDAAWNSEMRNLNEARNDAYNQMYLTGRTQALNEAYQERNQPLNEISALLTRSQVAMPGFGVAQPSGIPTTNNAGIIMDEYGQRRQNAANEYAANMDLFGGLFGAGATLLGADAGSILGRLI